MTINDVKWYDSSALCSETSFNSGKKKSKCLWFNINLLTRETCFYVDVYGFPTEETSFSFTDLESALNKYNSLDCNSKN